MATRPAEDWITIRLTKPVKEKLKLIAERDERSLSHIARKLIEDGLSKIE